MFRKLVLTVGVVLAVGIFGVVGTASADETLYGPSACDDNGANATNIFYSVGSMAYTNDLCNQFEIEQAGLLNDVIIDYFVRNSLYPLGPNTYPSHFPCARNDNAEGIEYVIGAAVQTNFHVNFGGLSFGSPGVHNVWYNPAGVTCLVGSAERAAANPISRIEAHSGTSFEAIWNEYVSRVNPVGSTRYFLTDVNGNKGCDPSVRMFNGVVTHEAETCFVATESILDYDAEFVAKRYPGSNAGQ